MEFPVAEKEFNNHDTLAQQAPQNVPHSAGKTRSRALWIILLVFFAFVVIVLLTERKDTINWVEDYEAGIKLAKQQNKPVFLAFYKSYIPTNTLERIYANRSIKSYIETRFVPILIDAAKQPEIAKRYNVNYYPAHYIKQPDSNEVFGPIGYRPPRDFIDELKGLIKKMELPSE